MFDDLRWMVLPFVEELSKNVFIFFRPVRMKIPLVLIRSKYQRNLPLARELFLVASREIEQIYSNLSNLFPICLICTDLYDFCPLGHSFFSHHIATFREHHFQSYLRIFLFPPLGVFIEAAAFQILGLSIFLFLLSFILAYSGFFSSCCQVCALTSASVFGGRW